MTNLLKNIVCSFFIAYGERRGLRLPFGPLLYFLKGGLMRNENKYQAGLIKRIKERFEGAIVLKNDSSYIQGIPDLTVFYKDRWAALECKKEKNAHHQPNQDYYISKMNEMSFARFISPENEEDILDEMEHAFTSRRSTRVSRRKSV